MKKEIAFFDFDGTITTKDTLLAFIQFVHGRNSFLNGFFRNGHFLVAYRLKLISNQLAKEKILEHFFKGMPLEKFQAECDRFASEMLPGLIRPAALAEINRLKREGVTVVVVSASPENWIRNWTLELKVDLIASQLEIKEGKLTGKILGKNCHGQEKVRRIMEKHVISDYDMIYAYGDTSGDKPMLSLASAAFYKPFRSMSNNKK